MTDSEPNKDQQIAQLKQRIIELEAAEKRYFNLFENAGDAIYIVDPITFDIIDANLPAARRLNYTHDELLTLNLDDIEVLPEEDEAHLLSAWESSFSGSRTYECHYRRKDGSLMSVEVTSHMVKIDNRQILQNAVRDITKRKNAEIALRDSNERLSILRQIDAKLTHQLDVQYVATQALDAAVRLSYADTGTISLAEGKKLRVIHALGQYASEIGTLLPQERGIIVRVARWQQPELVEDVSTDPDYVSFVPETRAQMTFPLVSNQRLIGVLHLETTHPKRFSPAIFNFIKLLVTRVAVAIDNANAYEEQTALVEELDAFAHTVAHDLKNPSGIILGFALLLTDETEQLSTDEVKKYLTLIANSSQKMVNIINELLLLASVRNLDEVETASIDMGHVVREALSRLTHMVEKYKPEIIMPESWPAAIGYVGWVEEVWVNYISNAIKYGGTPPMIEVGATLQDDGMVRYWVKDNGFGLDDEQQSRLFNQFTRLDKKRAQGHGLGLSIVKRIVQKLGGQVAVESEVGVGSVFNFTLPKSD